MVAGHGSSQERVEAMPHAVSELLADRRPGLFFRGMAPVRCAGLNSLPVPPPSALTADLVETPLILISN